MNDYTHYNDGMIDYRAIEATIEGFSDPINVFVNTNGDCKTVPVDNFFGVSDLVDAYEQMWRADWNMDDEKQEYLERFKRYLIEVCGCAPKELERE